MKNILVNKKLLTIITLLLLVISLSSCSATGYWWGEYQEKETTFTQFGTKEYWDTPIDFNSPWEAGLESIFAPVISLIGLHNYNFIFIIISVFWFFGLASALVYIGSNHNNRGKSYSITIGDKKHIIEDNGDLIKNRWDNKAIIYLLILIVFFILYNLITGWFDDLNLFFKLLIGCISAVISKGLCSLVLPFVETFKLIAWYFIAVDYVLAIIVTLWIN